jgi:GTPase SAR1 family protein
MILFQELHKLFPATKQHPYLPIKQYVNNPKQQIYCYPIRPRLIDHSEYEEAKKELNDKIKMLIEIIH